ncbi:MAG: HAD family hydrolase [Oscillospiraceae bacterium]|nr:HAD family hydrolase [Oscillospiraceae bacterium]
MLRAVLFDLDNTLYSYDEAHAAAWLALTDYAGEQLSLAPERFEALHAQADRTLRAHAGDGPVVHNRLIRYQLLLEALGQPLWHAPLMAACYWSNFLGRLRLFPGTKEGLEALRQAGCRLGVATNMTADRQFDKLERLGLWPWVDALVTSEELGAEKPDARVFLRCAEKLGCAAAECVCVGDGWKTDVLGAQNAGMLPVWFRPDGGEAEGVPVIRSLTELPELLKTL